MCLLILTLLTLTASTFSKPTIYEFVGQFGFPPGVLPDSVTTYSTSESDGFTNFAIYLSKPCYVKYEYLVYFDQEITGKATYGQISDVKGLKVQALGIWFTVNEIKVDGNSLQFNIGFMTVKADIAQYQSIPSCKDEALAACNDRSSKLISQLQVTAE
ncbi:hypothetical protein QVD17_11277 [Tagetes erecta]|uniref:Uncharacterized protein n=1 Tax=Tagetes erecta TaxID=13708 RepID=A0AAD8P1X4_TARER|nr:hypothetical protein QVD17_11277 [Tagetes erecta]